MKSYGFAPVQYNQCPYNKRTWHRQHRPRKGTGRKQESASHGERPQEKQNLSDINDMA